MNKNLILGNISEEKFKDGLIVSRSDERAIMPSKKHSIDSGYDIFIPKFESVVDVIETIQTTPLEFTSDNLTVSYIQKLNVRVTIGEAFSKAVFGTLLDTITQDEFTIYEMMTKYTSSMNNVISNILISGNLQVNGNNCRLNNKRDFFDYVKGQSGRNIPDFELDLTFYQVNNISMDADKYNQLSKNLFPKIQEAGKAQGIDFNISFEWDKPKLGVMIPPQEGVLINSYLRMSVKPGYDIVVNNKSGIASRKGLTVGAEIIDSGYFGRVFINLYNNTANYVPIFSEEKITQVIVRDVNLLNITELTEEEMTEYSKEFDVYTSRKDGKMGSTN